MARGPLDDGFHDARTRLGGHAGPGINRLGSFNFAADLPILRAVSDATAIERLPWTARTSRVARVLAAVQNWLPKGQLLPEHILRRRHKTIVGLMWAHVVGLVVFGLFQGQTVPHMTLEGAMLAAPAVLATYEWVPLRLRVAAAAFGLITASAMLVHLAHGVVEAHFHFFVMIGVLTLYQDWMAFGIAIGYVVLHHGVVGVLSPAQVYNHADAIAHPWRWAMIHGGFVLAASAAHVVAWRDRKSVV